MQTVGGKAYGQLVIWAMRADSAGDHVAAAKAWIRASRCAPAGSDERRAARKEARRLLDGVARKGLEFAERLAASTGADAASE